MAQFEVEDKRVSRIEESALPSNLAFQVPTVPGLSYIPDKIEITEDPVLLAKLNQEMLDFVKILSQVLDLMWILKSKYLRITQPLPAIIIEELLLNQGKGPRLKSLEAKLLEPIPVASPSVEVVLRVQSHQPILTSRREMNHKNVESPHPNKAFPFANDILEITGKRMRPIWHAVMLEKQEELSILKPKPPRKDSFVFKFNTNYRQCRINEELSRTKSETTMFSVKFASNDIDDPAKKYDEKLLKQVEMMVASHYGFRTVEEHKAYLSTLKSHWYNNFLNDVIKIGLFNCRDMVQAFESLAKHYHMNYNSLPLAKFILEKILLLPEKPLADWLRVRGVPYVIFPPYKAEDFLCPQESDPVLSTGVEDQSAGATATATQETSASTTHVEPELVLV